MEFVLAKPKTQAPTKEEKVKSTPKSNEPDARQIALDKAVPLMDEHKELHEKYFEDFGEFSAASLSRDFNKISKIVLNNIVPKTTKLKLKTRYNEWGINRYGPAKKHNYSSRYDSWDLRQISSEDNLRYEGFEPDEEGNKLPEDYRKLSDARKWIKASIEAIEEQKFRTRKRSILRLQKLDKFLEKYEKTLGKREGEFEIEIGKKLVYCEAPHYSSRPGGWKEVPLRLKYTVNGRFILKAKLKNTNVNAHSYDREHNYEWTWDSAMNEFPEAIAWGSVMDELDEIFEKLKEQREEQQAEIKEATDALRKNFTKELLVAKTKEMG